MKVHDQQVVGEGSGTSRDLGLAAGGASLDTSGHVLVPLSMMTTGDVGLNGSHHHHTFAGLSSFEQGYTAKGLEEAWANPEFRADFLAYYGSGIPLSFHHLAPETLAAIKKDCAAFTCGLAGGRATQSDSGKAFWAARQAHFGVGAQEALYAQAFPPVHLFLGDDGKVYARVSA